MGILEVIAGFRMTHRRCAIMNTALAILILVSGVSFPLRIGPITTDAYNEIEALEPGDTIAWAQNCAFGAYISKRDVYRAMVFHALLDNDARLIIYSFDPDAPQLNAALMVYCEPVLTAAGKVYGTDWIIMPFLAGEESALAASAKNMRVTGNDLIEGRPLEEFPIMEGIYTMADIPLTWNDAGSFTFCEMWIRQWPAAYDNRAIGSMVFATAAPVYGIYVHGYLDGVRGYAEYQKLTGYLGDHLQKMDMRNAQGIGIIAIVLMGNLTYFARKKLGLPQIAGVSASSRRASRQAREEEET